MNRIIIFVSFRRQLTVHMSMRRENKEKQDSLVRGREGEERRKGGKEEGRERGRWREGGREGGNMSYHVL